MNKINVKQIFEQLKTEQAEQLNKNGNLNADQLNQVNQSNGNASSVTSVEQISTTAAENMANPTSAGTNNTVATTYNSAVRTYNLGTSNALTIQTFTSPQFGEPGTWAFNTHAYAGKYGNSFYYSVCTIDVAALAQFLNVDLSTILFGTLRFENYVLTEQNIAWFVNYGQRFIAPVVSSDTDSIVLNIADFYNPSTGFVEFLVLPINANAQGYFHFIPTSMSIINDGQVSSIRITQNPTKTKYLPGEAFNANGIKILATDVNDKLLNNLTQRECSVVGQFDSSFYDETISTINECSLAITASFGGISTTNPTELNIQVYPTSNVYYGDTSIPVAQHSGLQTMDIHVPKNADGSYKQGPFPVVITIHGGSWAGDNTPKRGYYDYMTDFITQDCDCIHVNIDYRLTDGNYNLGDFTYVDMLEDINSAINYLTAENSPYPINSEKIALMGYSAGGHLALLYAYKSAAGHSVNGNPMHPISLVISEAGPIQFASKTVYNENEVEYGYVFADDNVCAMAGITMPNTTDLPEVYNEKLAILAAVSPYCVAQDIEDKSTLPYTILAYGNIFDNGIATNNDGLVPIQPARDLDNLLNTNNGEYLNHSKCSLFELNNVAHNYFGISVHPDTGNLSSRMYEYCASRNDHNGTNNALCSECNKVYTNIFNNLSYINSYYDKIYEKLNQLINN